MCFPPINLQEQGNRKEDDTNKTLQAENQKDTQELTGNLRRLNSKLAGVLHYQIKAKGILGTLGNAG